MGEWEVHVALLGVTVYALLRIREKRRIDDLLASYGPDVKLPPHLISYVPYLGSAIEMGKGIRVFIAKHSAKFGEPLFTATIAGEHALFIGDSDHLPMIYTHSKQLDGFALQKQFTRNVLGIKDNNDEELMFDMDNESEIATKLVKQYHKYILSDGELNKTVAKAQDIFNTLIPRLIDSSSIDGWHRHDLYGLVRELIFEASVEPFLSKHLATKENSELFQMFDKGVPLMFGNAPSFIVKESDEAREELLKRITDGRFIEQGSDLMKERQELLPDNVFQRTALGLLFASVGNSIPSVFWCLYHILLDPVARKAVQAEVDSVVEMKRGGGGTISLSLDELKGMEILSSCFSEALRLYQGAFTVREATDNFVFDPKKKGQHRYLIQKGTRVMAFQSTLHYNEALFDRPETFQYDRFLPKNGKQVSERNIRPFGGGTRLCPGRKFIRYEVQAFVALLLSQFDMRIVEGSPQPNINYAMQGVGISHPDKSIMVEMRLRKKD
eukprot:scaffold2848_cov150-Skeletonema_menzelii.AAC.6